MADADFFNMFIDRCTVYMGDFLNEKGIRAVWDPMYELIKYEYPNHRKLINQWCPNYNDELSNARKWVSKRTDIFRQHLADYYHLGTPTTLTINKDMTDLGNIRFTVNDIPLSEGIFDGKFFGGREVRIAATPADGKQVTGWDITVVSSNGTVTKEQIEGATHSFTMPTGGSVIIKAVLGTTGIHTVKDRPKTDNTPVYNLWGHQVDAHHKGILIRNGVKVVNK